MQSKHLDVSHVLMVVDPAKFPWRTALNIADALVETGVRTTLACVQPPSPQQLKDAKKIEGIDVRYEPNVDSLEWMLFLEMLVQPDLVQLFDPSHVLLPWRSSTVLHIPDSALLHPTKPLFDACASANLIVVEDEARFDKLQAIVGTGPFVAVLNCNDKCGWNYFLAYQEIVQAVRLDLGEDSVGRFELI